MTANDQELDEELLSACRTTVGDELRSLTYFTADDHRLIYLREDLEHDGSIETFAANERMGFASQGTYEDPELGDYEATVRVFENGYLTRVIVGDHGAFITTDEMKIERFSETAESVEEILAEFR
ncbi:DUF7522 family protein [Natronomonas marina]|jgi:hypothetical protein|uniref:DUF7522 family protein n=1 Tax=Natronomonas marina TaxID=2961939 RepID=UPI0020CA07CF|nr:hypothetical protein [Natronomonas marina]